MNRKIKNIYAAAFLTALPLATGASTNQKIDVNNCYAEDIDQPMFCRVVKGDPEIYSWDWFLSTKDKYGAELDIAASIGGNILDGDLSRNDVADIVDTIGAAYGVGPIASMLGFGGASGPSTEELMHDYFTQIIAAINQSQDKIIESIIDEIDGVVVQEDNAATRALYNNLESWAVWNDFNEKSIAQDNGDLGRMKDDANQLFERRFENFNIEQHIDRLHGSLQVASTYMQLELENIRITKLRAHPEYFLLYSDLSTSFKDYEGIQSEEDFTNWKKSLDDEVADSATERWRTITNRAYQYLVFLDDSDEWRREVDSWFSSPTSTSFSKDIYGSSYRLPEYNALYNSAEGTGCQNGSLVMTQYNKPTFGMRRWVSYENQLYTYEVNGAVHNIRKIVPTCNIEDMETTWGTSQRFGQVVSDDFGNTFDTVEEAIAWHKNLEYERLVKNVYSPAKDVVQEWWHSLAMEANGYIWDMPESDNTLVNPTSYLWRHYVLDSRKSISSWGTYSSPSVSPGFIKTFRTSGLYGDVTVRVTGADSDKLKIGVFDCAKVEFGNLNQLDFSHTMGFQPSDNFHINLSSQVGSRVCFGVTPKNGIVDPIAFTISTENNSTGDSELIIGEDLTDDADGDGLSLADEYAIGTDPYNKDTDGDGIDDYYESITENLDPTNASDASLDSDSDGYTNFSEYQVGSDPNNQNSTPESLKVAAYLIPVLSILLN